VISIRNQNTHAPTRGSFDGTLQAQLIVPTKAVLRASNLGTPVTICSGDSPPARAYIAAARRLAGENIEMTIPTERKGFFNKLFGRRAA
jgi:septum site-determining protein MinD